MRQRKINFRAAAFFAEWNERMNKGKTQLSLISTVHFLKLAYRSILFALALGMYVIGRGRESREIAQGFAYEKLLMGIIWVAYAAEMVFRFFPSKTESMGCQKQFEKNYRPTGRTEPKLQSWKRTFAVAAVWLILNAFIGALYYASVFDQGILLLISLAYGVCDMICILFFCPFQTWIMKNRCCTVCRIYNWDFAMMFTPYVFIPGLYTWSLLALSLLLLARWEITVRKHPERFSDRTNASVSCINCKEKLCHHKTQLKSFLAEKTVKVRKTE